uniref:Uncharacterized protein n=2 Tax=Lotharella globosa TaxID=91324 RepID=A0A7S4DLB6_9EUKA
MMPIVTGVLMLVAWMVPGCPEVREKALHWACILREWCLLDVYWLASIVSMFELPEITSYIADEFKDIGRFGRIELTMSPRHTLFWLPIVMSVENLVFFHMKTKLDSEPEVTFGKFNGH